MIQAARKILFSTAIALLACVISAQTDTTIALPQVEVTGAPPFPGSEVISRETWEDSILNTPVYQNLGALLDENSSIYVKTYGGGGIATTTIRGSSSGQVATMWNGLPIQNSMVGLADLSIMPTSLFQSVRLERGGNSALHGSGAVGGSLDLRSATDFRKGYDLGLIMQMGSFGSQNLGGKLRWSNGRITTSAKGFSHKAVNDFPYSVDPGLPERTLSHAMFRQSGFMQDLGWMINSRNKLSAHFWWGETDREIPPKTTQTVSEATQYDRAARFMLEWQNIGPVTQIFARAGYFDEGLVYQDLRASEYSDSRISTFAFSGGINHSLSRGSAVSGGLQYLHAAAQTDAYDAIEDQNRIALYCTYTGTPGSGWLIETTARAELIDDEFAPFSFSAGVKKQTTPWLALRGRLNRDYRIPGLNDLYWKPGGNTALQPEKSFGGEIGADLEFPGERHTVNSTITGYMRTVDDWIMWSPQEGVPYWAANNLTKVWSRGAEVDFLWCFPAGPVVIENGAGYSYAVSTNQVAIALPSIDAGEQLIYTPWHNGFLSTKASWKGINFSYRHSFTGEVNTDANTTLSGYNTGNVRLSGTLVMKSLKFLLVGEINNIWNENYEVILYRPMPGRNFNIGLTIQFSRYE